MEPVEVLEVVQDDDGHILEIRGSQELLDKCADFAPEVPRVVKEPEMLTLKLPELEDENGNLDL